MAPPVELPIEGVDAKIIDTTSLTREQWLELRSPYVGASEVAAILEESPWGSPWSVWAKKSGLIPVKNLTDDVVMTGKYAERAITPWFEDLTGLHVRGEQTLCISNTVPFAAATLDAFVFENSLDLVPVAGGEWKTAAPGASWAEIPVYYQCQGQWQMLVTGLDVVYFAVLSGWRIKPEIIRLERDQNDIDFLVERVGQWWDRHVIGGEPPPVTGHQATIEAMGDVWPEHVEGLEVDITAHQDIWDSYQEAKEQVRQAEKKQKEAQALLLDLVKDAEAAVVTVQNPDQSYETRRVFTAKAQTRVTTDMKRLEKERPFIAKRIRDEYTTETKYRVLRPCSTKKERTPQ